MAHWHHRLLLALSIEPIAYRLAQAYYETSLYLEEAAKQRDPIIVYQMGKVGSSSLYATLKSVVPDRMIYHVHNLTNEGIEAINYRSTSRMRAFPGPGYWQARHLYRKITARSNQQRWHLITLTRDPVARNLSGFFQSLPLWSTTASRRFSNGERQSLFEELLDIFLQQYPHDYAHRWFDFELKKVFDIDIYESTFHKDSGYNIYNGANASTSMY